MPALSLPTLRKSFVAFRPHLKGQGFRIALTFVAAFLTTGLELLGPWPMKFIFDGVFARGGDRPFGLSPARLIVVAALAHLVISYLHGTAYVRYEVLKAQVSRRAVKRLRRQVFDHLHRLALPFHQSQRTGELLARMMRDVESVRRLLFETWLVGLERGVYIVGAIVLMFLLDPWFALLAIAPTPFLALWIGRKGQRMKKVVRKQRKSEGQAVAFAAESLRHIRVTKAYAKESDATDRFIADAWSSERSEARVAKLAAEMTRATDVLTGLGTALVLTVGGLRVISGKLTPGDIIVGMVYARMLYRPVRTLTREGGRFSKAIVGAERLLEILHIPPEEFGVGRPAERFTGRVEFAGVRYAYDGRGDALAGVSFTLEPGTLAALCGPNGSGKSTLLSVLLRLLTPQEGQVLIDGTPAEDFEIQSYRRRFAYVPQEIQLFRGTIRENILYGRPDAGDADVRDAARVALLDDLVEQLPDGYDTVVGESAATLSGGEARRLMLARAAVRDARILLLDEPFAGLHPDAREIVAKAIRGMAAGRTTLVVSHGDVSEIGPDVVLQFSHGAVEATHVAPSAPDVAEPSVLRGPDPGRSGGAFARLDAVVSKGENASPNGSEDGGDQAGAEPEDAWQTIASPGDRKASP
jgi:ATP-binding cassette subfamily B protein